MALSLNTFNKVELPLIQNQRTTD